MDAEARIEQGDVRGAARIAREHPRRAALGALAFDILSRQAEGGTLFAGREFVQGRAEAHGVSRESADAGGVNLLSILERGPESPRERALVVAFAIAGLEARVESVPEGERDAARARFVRHADWLEVATPYVVYSLIDDVLSPGAAAAFWRTVGTITVSDSDGSSLGRARSTLHVAALAASSNEAAVAERARIAESAADPVTRALAAALSGNGAGTPLAPVLAADPGETTRIAGEVGHAPSTSFRTVLRLVSGVAAVQWLARLVARAAGVRREVELELVANGVRVRRRTSLMGRVIREAEESYTLAALAGAGRESRYPALHLLVGLVALSAGVLGGGLLIFDGVRSGETVLLLLGAAAILVGGGLDLALAVLVPGRAARVALDLRVMPKRTVRVVGVPLPEADRFLAALERRLARR